MTYTARMSLDLASGYPGWEKELDSLLAAYGSETFTESILQVYSRDCPRALERLLSTLEAGDLEQARNAAHSLSNILGVVGPAASGSLITAISANLRKGQLDEAARYARELGAMISSVVISIQNWLEKHSKGEVSVNKTPGETVDGD